MLRRCNEAHKNQDFHNNRDLISSFLFSTSSNINNFYNHKNLKKRKTPLRNRHSFFTPVLFSGLRNNVRDKRFCSRGGSAASTPSVGIIWHVLFNYFQSILSWQGHQNVTKPTSSNINNFYNHKNLKKRKNPTSQSTLLLPPVLFSP